MCHTPNGSTWQSSYATGFLQNPIGPAPRTFELGEPTMIDIDKLERHSRFLKFSGVYLLFDNLDNIIYIGQSRDIQKRLLNHSKKPWAYFKYIELSNFGEMAKTESDLIKRYKPVYNKTDTEITYRQYTNRTSKKDRLLAEDRLRDKYGDNFSSRQMRMRKLQT
jgi:excinuclease UvrABC nuclease subunit